MRLINNIIIAMFILANALYLQPGFAALTDPTKPADFEAKPGSVAPATLQLNGVVISSDQKIAIINGQTVKVGDKISGKQVVDIKDDQVELLGPGGGTITLNISGGLSIKKPR